MLRLVVANLEIQMAQIMRVPFYKMAQASAVVFSRYLPLRPERTTRGPGRPGRNGRDGRLHLGMRLYLRLGRSHLHGYHVRTFSQQHTWSFKHASHALDDRCARFVALLLDELGLIFPQRDCHVIEPSCQPMNTKPTRPATWNCDHVRIVSGPVAWPKTRVRLKSNTPLTDLQSTHWDLCFISAYRRDSTTALIS